MYKRCTRNKRIESKHNTVESHQYIREQENEKKTKTKNDKNNKKII